MAPKHSDRALAWPSLMALAQGGDAAAYRRLLTEMRPLIRSLARRHGLDESAREDLVQDVSVSLHRGLQSYDPSRPFSPWLLRIVRRRIADWQRSNYRRLEAVMPDPEDLSDFADPSSKSDMEVTELRAWIGRALQELPPGQRRAVELIRLRELSLAEASLCTGQSSGAIKISVHRGIRSLQANAMGRHGQGRSASFADLGP